MQEEIEIDSISVPLRQMTYVTDDVTESVASHISK